MGARSSDDTAEIRLPVRASWRACERRIKAFEEAWQDSRHPSIAAYLVADEGERLALLVELVHVDLEFRFKSGDEARTEEYFQRFPELARDAKIAIDLLAAECDLRLRQRGTIDLDEMRARFPTYAPLLVAVLNNARATVLSAEPSPASEERMERPNVPGYEILGELGRGGMGVVYRARDLLLDRPVALKFLPSAYARDPERLARFAREARTASALNHPHICTIHTLGTHESRPYLVMELIEGFTLESLLGKRVALPTLTSWLSQAARALAVAHGVGVVHRDVKPANLMVRADGYVKVLDFGLARRLPSVAHDAAALSSDTDPGVFLGTAAYASPEQARGEPVGSASDIFSLGIVLYELATGRHPFPGDSALAILRAINMNRFVPAALVNPAIPPALDGLLEGMLSKETRLRPTAAEIDAALASLSGMASPRAAPGTPRGALVPPRAILHRDTELSVLSQACADADTGQGTLVCVIGEPGIGKTTLVEDFLDQLTARGGAHVVIRGRCSERLASTEAYLPIIDGLGELLRADPISAVRRALMTVAPTWYAQAAPVSTQRTGASGSAANVEHGGAPAPANSQQAILREFVAFLREAAVLQTVVLFFDDVHWADASTVDLLSHLGRHLPQLRLLIVVTCRRTELLLEPHPFHRIQLELQTRGLCRELPLGLLDRPQVDRYLALVFGAHAFPPSFVDLIYAQTEGSPLFVAELLRYLRERGVVAEADGRWSLVTQVPDLRQHLPASVRGMIQRKLELLDPIDHRLLTAASVQGHEFDAALVTSVLDLDEIQVEERLQVLERVHGLVRLVREHEFPDRKLTLRYAFVHGLYQQALYANLSATRRAKLSVTLADALARHQRPGSQPAAAELACLYEVGRDFYQAARYLWLAAQNGARVCAHADAIVLAERGLRQLEQVPESPRRRELELSLQMALGLQLQVTEGYAAPAAQRAYLRARQLCEQAGTAPPFAVLWGLWLFAKVRSQLDRARALADELLALAQRLRDPALVLQAQQAQTVTALCRGAPAAALHNMEHGALLYDPLQHGGHSAEFGQDPDVACRAFAAVALWLLGNPDQALRMSDEAVARSHELQHPSTQALALHFAAMLHQLRRDPSRTRACSEVASAIAAEHGLSFWAAGADVLAGWAGADEGAPGGIDRLRRGIQSWLATGSVTYQTYYLGLLAEALGKRGALDDAIPVVDEALMLTLKTGEGLYLAELHRLRGELLWQSAGPGPAAGPHGDCIEQEFRTALDVARRQEAKAFELRAALSLARFARAGSASHASEACVHLERILHSLPEGPQTPDLQEVRRFLDDVRPVS